MPYGVLDPQRLSQASRSCVERALDWWQKSMQTTKHKTYLVLAGYDVDHGQEIKLRRELVDGKLQDPELIGNIVEVSANNEVGLTQKISRIRALLPVETITVFVEARNAISVKAIFKRKFGKTLQIRKFKADFEFNHQWITTSTSIRLVGAQLVFTALVRIEETDGAWTAQENPLLVQRVRRSGYWSEWSAGFAPVLQHSNTPFFIVYATFEILAFTSAE